MAKGKGGGGGLLLIILFVIICIIITVSNILNFPLLVTHGPSLYVSNIWHGHVDRYFKAKSNFEIYEKILPLSVVKEKDPIAILRVNNRFKFKGYKQEGSITWVAVRAFKGSKVVNGFFIIPAKSEDSTFWSSIPFHKGKEVNNTYFSEVEEKEIEAYRAKMTEQFIDLVQKNVNIQKADGNLKVQEINESEDYEIIPYISNDEIAYYCSKNEFEIVASLNEKLLGNNFQTHFLQLEKKYDLYSAEVFHESTVMKIISSWYFKIGFPIFLWIFMKIVSAGRSISENGDRYIEREPEILSCISEDLDESVTYNDCDTSIDANNAKAESESTQKRLRELTSLLEEGLIDDNDFERQRAILIKNDYRNDASQTAKENMPQRPKKGNWPSKGKATIIRISQDMTVDELKSLFKSSSNIEVRIYDGKIFANANASLYSLGYKPVNDVNLKLNKKITVDRFEKAFKKNFGITIQIENRKGKLADNALRLNDL